VSGLAGDPSRRTPSRAADFQRDGYVVVRGVVERSRALALAEEAAALVARRAPDVQLQWTRRGEVSLVKIPQLAERSASFADLAHDPNVVDVVEELIGAGARLFRDVVVGKPARTGTRLSAHQDSAYWDVEPKALVSAWIALTDASAERSPLELVPRSHQGLLPHGLVLGERFELPATLVRVLRSAVSAAGSGDNPEASGGSRPLWRLKTLVLTSATRLAPWLASLQDYRVPPSALAGLDPVLLPVAAGDAVFFHSLIVHGTPPNRTEAHRFAHIVSYMPAGARCKSLGSESFPAARRA
jgi:ectoine hydroxylase-related dioxygenase (phytanoyl-CoA dioxygenase family)